MSRYSQLRSSTIKIAKVLWEIIKFTVALIYVATVTVAAAVAFFMNMHYMDAALLVLEYIARAIGTILVILIGFFGPLLFVPLFGGMRLEDPSPSTWRVVSVFALVVLLEYIFMYHISQMINWSAFTLF
jgi:hypothetical protein